MIYKNDRVEYRGRTYTVVEVGEDGSLALHPIMLRGCGWNRDCDLGETEVDKNNLGEVRVINA